jgi:ribosomal protein S28E/S33
VLAAPEAWLERLAEMRDVALEHVRGRLGGRVAPKVVDQPIRRNDLVRVQEEQREDGPLLRAPERQ